MSMRVAIINGIEDNLHIEIPGSIYLFCIVSKVGKAKNPLTYEAYLTGKELLDVLNEARIPDLTHFAVKEENHYRIFAFDD